MSAKKKKKKVVVQEITEKIKASKSVILVDYNKLTVKEVSELRSKCKKAGCEYKVYKNTMMNFAFKDTDFEGLSKYLEGPSAMAVSATDATAPARELAKFAKTADKLEIKGGVVEGNLYDAAGIASIATIPAREELISRLLGSLQAPITNFARVMNQLAEKGGADAVEAASAEEAPAETAEAPVEETPAAEAPAEEAPAAE